jgi:hypothetical protein
LEKLGVGEDGLRQQGGCDRETGGQEPPRKVQV